MAEDEKVLEIEVDRAKLLGRIDIVGKILVTRHSVIPIISNLFISKGHIFATDLLIGADVYCEDCGVRPEIEALVPGMPFLKLLKVMPDEKVTVSFTKSKAVFRSGSHKTELEVTNETEEFPTIPFEGAENETRFEITEETLKAVSVCMPFCGWKDHTGSRMSYIHFDDYGIWATDGKAICLCTTKTENLKQGECVVFDAKMLSVLKALELPVICTLNKETKMVKVESGQTRLVLSQPDFGGVRLFNKDIYLPTDIEFVQLPEGFADAIKRVHSLIDFGETAESGACDICFTPEKTTIARKASSLSLAQGSRNTEETLNGCETNMTTIVAIEYLRNIVDFSTKFGEFKTGTLPLLMFANEDESIRTVVCPIVRRD